MDTKTLQVFLAVDASLSFTRAASELHMSVSAISRCIARLEDELGCQLFERNRRSMSPTSAAPKLRAYAEQSLRGWRDLQRAVDEGATLAGDLRVFCSVTATHRLLSPLLAAYRDSCPGVDVLLQTGDQADGLDRVRQGSADVALIAQPEQLPAALDFLPLTESPLRLCLPRLDCAVSRTLRDNRDQALLTALHLVPWILPQRGLSKDRTDHWLVHELGLQPRIYARVSGHEAIAAMISLGLGVGILPELVVAASGVADALELHTLPHLAPLHIGLCARRARLDDPVLASFWALAQAPR